MFSGTVRNLLASGKLLMNGKYIPYMAVDVYDDDTVVMFNDGNAYDGDVGNLITFCKDNSATFVPTVTYTDGKEDVSSPLSEVPETPVKEQEDNVDAGNTAPVDDGADAQQVHAEVGGAGTPAIKQEEPAISPGTASVGPGEKIQRVVSLAKHELFMTQTLMMFHELVRASSAGVTPNRKMIDDLAKLRGPAKRMFDAPPKVRKRGGTIEQLFEKFRNVPAENIFTEDIETLFPHPGERKSALEAAQYVQRLVSEYG
jgi:hypothetical protein